MNFNEKVIFPNIWSPIPLSLDLVAYNLLAMILATKNNMVDKKINPKKVKYLVKYFFNIVALIKYDFLANLFKNQGVYQ